MEINEALLEKHLHNGRYHVRSIWDEDVKPSDTFDNPLAMMMFSDNDEEATAEIERRSPTTAEAIRRNEEGAANREAEKEAKAQREALINRAAELLHQDLNANEAEAQLTGEGVSKQRARHAVAKVRLRENRPSK